MTRWREHGMDPIEFRRRKTRRAGERRSVGTTVMTDDGDYRSNGHGSVRWVKDRDRVSRAHTNGSDQKNGGDDRGGRKLTMITLVRPTAILPTPCRCAMKTCRVLL